MLSPIKQVPINFAGLSIKLERMIPLLKPCFFELNTEPVGANESDFVTGKKAN